MIYTVKFTKYALKSLKKLDKFTQSLIIGWIEKNLVNTTNPYFTGKRLKGDFSGMWRYRINDYRIIAEIIDAELIILILEVGHRKQIYQ